LNQLRLRRIPVKISNAYGVFQPALKKERKHQFPLHASTCAMVAWNRELQKFRNILQNIQDSVVGSKSGRNEEQLLRRSAVAKAGRTGRAFGSARANVGSA
jgi:hypothetical protein